MRCCASKDAVSESGFPGHLSWKLTLFGTYKLTVVAGLVGNIELGGRNFSEAS